jgi:cystathionine beta-lyase/cystathionine gamma-synthase
MGDGHELDTQLIHAGEPLPRPMGAVTMPIFQSATYEYGGEGEYDALRYLRLNNTPNHATLHTKLAALENAEASLVSASGMAAITTTLLATLSPGDHLLAQRTLYGGTHDFVTQTLARLGITCTFVDGNDPASWESAVTSSTRAFYVEAMTNPLLEVADLKAAAAFARAKGLVSVIDATFATPVVFRPTDAGFDLVVHSATKYLNGHSDITAGVVAGSGERVDAIRRLQNHLGGNLDPHACFLLQRGLKTLGVRVRHQCASALRIASFLSEHPNVERVSYPGLPNHPNHARAKELFKGFGGMLSFELRGGADAARRASESTKLFVNAPSLGGAESLITLPAKTSHVGLDAAVRRELGIADGLVRLSVGLEDTDDLIADLRAALD